MKLKEFQKNINIISNETWEEIKKESLVSAKHWNAMNEWWNTKFYKNNPPNDGTSIQTPLKGKPEIPETRKIFYQSEYRFSLKNQSVGYFSNEFAMMCCETIRNFRDSSNNLWKEQLKPYLDGNTNPTPDAHGYPLNFMLRSNVTILDLRKNSKSLSLFDRSPKFNIKEIIYYRDDENYKFTWEISEIALKKKFDGIVYDSVRKPNDINLLGYNLVMFAEEKITEWSADKFTKSN